MQRSPPSDQADRGRGASAKQTALVQQLDQTKKAKVAASTRRMLPSKPRTLWLAQLASGQSAAEKAIAESAQAEKAATDALAAAKAATEKSLADKTANDPALATAIGALKAAATPEATAAAAAELAKQAQKMLSLVQAMADSGMRQSAARTALAQTTAAKNSAPSNGRQCPNDGQSGDPGFRIRSRPHHPRHAGKSRR